MAAPLPISATKRKFYRLLDNLSSSRANLHASNGVNNASTTTLSGATPRDRPSKRTRTSDVTADGSPIRPTTAPAGMRPSHYAFLEDIYSPRPRASKFKPEEPARVKNYMPYSRPQFLERLKTFADVKLWTPKPDSVNEVEWAKRGWNCDSFNTVACKGGCEERVTIKLHPEEKNERGEFIEGSEDWNQDIDLDLVHKYKALIVDGHGEGCPWAREGYSKDVYRIRFGPTPQWSAELAKRYDSLMAIEPAFPEQIIRPNSDPLQPDGGPHAFDIDQLLEDTHAKYWIPSADPHRPKTAQRPSTPTTQTSVTEQPEMPNATTPAAEPNTFSPSQEPEEAVLPTVNPTAALLSLCGWSGQTTHSIHQAVCELCFAHVGLWLYTSNPAVQILPNQLNAEDVLRFDPLALHRVHCPWRNPRTNSALEEKNGLNGFECQLRLLQKSAIAYKMRYAPEDPLLYAAPTEEEIENYTVSPESIKRRREQAEKEDRAIESRLKRLKRALSRRKSKKAT
ncbi:zf-C3HC-domain-containing protein [Aulographum hederae CBS 113979]|uniref:Zf-C3HC-domain-containing protein n=1 Tax=Aulographum hederae CBS 113979 TaxID=1176131 RepID=A0A6G1GMA7_9PEZI|nr:zf-C3HC-domain-containing protein [Aulographum hederae CBS 113979]